MERLITNTITTLTEDSYVINVDSEGMINVELDKIVTIPVNSKLIIQLLNGCKISKNILY